MNVVAVEMGNRPFLMTKSRRFAPEGVKLLAELLGRLTFADDAIVVLDWTNETNRQPDEVAKPVVFVSVLKNVDGRNLTVEVRLDVEDTFGRDTLIADDFITIVSSMEDYLNETIRKSKED